jgi:hypothetical protein
MSASDYPTDERVCGPAESAGWTDFVLVLEHAEPAIGGRLTLQVPTVAGGEWR